MTSHKLAKLPGLEALAGSSRILLAGAGGGFDIFSGLPLYFHLKESGKEVFLASLSFSELKGVQGRRIGAEVVEVGPDAGGEELYFPERYLSEWFQSRGEEVPLYCFPPMGGHPVLTAYQDLVRELQPDALVLVDGGTDSLMCGNEPGLGSPAEDMASLAAAHRLELPVKLLVNLGFGVDTHHGVCHAYVLEALAELTKSGDFLGGFSLLPGMPEFELFAEAVDYVNGKMPEKESIVATSVIASGRGHFGDHHPTLRTHGSEMFLNPLMSMYWFTRIDGVAKRCLYLDFIYDTYSKWDVHRAITNFLTIAESRQWRDIPL